MSSTPVLVDTELIARVMDAFGLRSGQEAVDLALRRLLRTRVDASFLHSLDGIGWDGDLDAMRRDRVSADSESETWSRD